MGAFTTAMQARRVHRANKLAHRAPPAKRAKQVLLVRWRVDQAAGRAHRAQAQAKAGNRPWTPPCHPVVRASSSSTSAGTSAPRDKTVKTSVQLTAASTPNPSRTSARLPKAAAATTANESSTPSAVQPRSSHPHAATATASAATSGKTQTTTGSTLPTSIPTSSYHPTPQ